MSDTLKHYESQWEIERTKSERLEQENLKLTAKIEMFENKLSEQATESRKLEEKIFALNNKLERCHAQLEAPEKLEALQKRLLTPSEWTEEFIVPFVEELDAFSFLSELQHSRNANTPTDWCKGLLENLYTLKTDYEAREVKQAKKVVIALWIYLQWLEIIHEDS